MKVNKKIVVCYKINFHFLVEILYARPSMFLFSFPKCLDKLPDLADFFNFSLRILDVSLKFDLSITTLTQINFTQK